MANSNFVVQNGLTAGPLTIFSGNGDIITTGNVTSSAVSESFTSINNTVIGNIAPAAGTFTNLSATSSTQSTSTTTGALVVTGGAGISGNVNIGGNLTVQGTQTTINNTTVETTEFVQTIDATTVRAATIGNASATITGTNSTLTNLGSTTLVATNFSTANAQISGGTLSGLTSIGATTGNFGTVNTTTLNNTSGNITNLGGTTAVYTNLSSGNIQGTFNGTVVATVATANVSIYDSVTALTTNQNFYPQLSNLSISGNTVTGVSPAMSFNPSTGTLLTTVLTSPTVNSTSGNITNLGSTTGVITNFSTGNAQITGGTVNFTTAGATTGNFGTVNTAVLNNTSGNITNLGGTTGVYTNFSSGNIYSTGAHIPNANATVNLGGTSAYWNNFYAVSGNFNTITVGAGGGILPAANVSVNIGSSSSWFNVVYGKAVQAQYADLAENYQADKPYNPGTVMMFGGSAEVTVAEADTTRVAGVVSTNPATLMNGGLVGAAVVPLALTGRVPCNVIGPVQKGDIMVSAGFGYAKVNNTPQIGTIIGKALEDFPITAKGVIEVVVGRF